MCWQQWLFVVTIFYANHEIILQWKLPDLLYLCICTGIVLSPDISFYLFACRETYNQLHCLIGQWTALMYTLIFLGGCVMHRLVVPVLKCPHCNLCNLLWNYCNLCDEWDIEMNNWQKWLNSSLTQGSYSKMREGSVILITSPNIKDRHSWITRGGPSHTFINMLSQYTMSDTMSL